MNKFNDDEILLKLNYSAHNAASRAAQTLLDSVSDKYAVLCLGSDKTVCDSLGPLTGTFLETAGIIPIFGTLEKPVHAENAAYNIDKIRYLYPGYTIICVDAGTLSGEAMGSLIIMKKGVELPNRTGSGARSAGDISVVGITGFENENKANIHMTNLNTVCAMAKTVSEAIRIFSLKKTLDTSELYQYNMQL